MMKTYKQFKDFVFQEKYYAVRWCFIRQEAIKAGFNRHLFDFYKWVSQIRLRYKKTSIEKHN